MSSHPSYSHTATFKKSLLNFQIKWFETSPSLTFSLIFLHFYIYVHQGPKMFVLACASYQSHGLSSFFYLSPSVFTHALLCPKIKGMASAMAEKPENKKKKARTAGMSVTHSSGMCLKTKEERMQYKKIRNSPEKRNGVRNKGEKDNFLVPDLQSHMILYNVIYTNNDQATLFKQFANRAFSSQTVSKSILPLHLRAGVWWTRNRWKWRGILFAHILSIVRMRMKHRADQLVWLHKPSSWSLTGIHRSLMHTCPCTIHRFLSAKSHQPGNTFHFEDAK